MSDIDVDTDSTSVPKDAPKEEKFPSRIGGSKGIKAGRQKGVKNKSTLLRLALTEDFDKELEKNFKGIIRAVAQQALDGCRTSQKMIIDRIIPTIHAESDKDKGQKFAGGIHITIGSLEDAKVISIDEGAIEADYEELDDSDS